MELLDDLKIYIEKNIRRTKDLEKFPADKSRTALLQGYLEAMEEILEFIEDNE